MTGSGGPAELAGFETFGAAVGLAVICGAVSFVFPPMVGLTGALSALALAGWAASRRAGSALPRRPHPGTVLALLGVAGVGALFLLGPAAWGSGRALLLGLGLVPLWLVERRGWDPSRSADRP